MPMFKVKEFAAYVSNEYFEKFRKNISPVRLQKTLYFCFAFWGGFVRKGKILQDNDRQEIDVTEYDEYLFNAKFEAWVYGPVIPEIYHEHNLESYYKENLIDDEFVKEYIDELLEDINSVSDFRLVDISHQDQAWIRNFEYDDENHSREINKEDIINEYVQK
ncbi:MAG: DUF4065 domain-containing protein [Clostridia bacterium]|nr:DUF4065 domain-containing protein [Clostridia bacterium]